MKLTTVLGSVNNNPKYYMFIPKQILFWGAFNIKFIAIFVGEEIPEELISYKDNIILWNFNLDINTAYVAQNIRIYYPALLNLPENEMVMITDMDMLPMNYPYYTNDLESYKIEDFIYYRHIDKNEIYMCYNASHPSTWKKIFGINGITDIKNKLYENYSNKYDGVPGCDGWSIDQKILYKQLINYPNLRVLNRPIKRLEMYNWCYNLSIFDYDDAHFHRNYFNNIKFIKEAEKQLNAKYISINDYVFDEKEVITNDKFLELSKKYHEMSYIKIDSLVDSRQINWRGLIHPIPFPPKNKIIISGHSDYTVDENLYEKFKNCSIYWCSVNMNLPDSYDKILKLPLGITNYCNDSNIHKIYGDTNIMKQVLSENNDIKRKCIYLNINVESYPKERKQVYDIFSEKPFVTLGKIDSSLEGRKTFLRDIKEHKFVLCPRGNGIDTHRLWETLYMKSIPILLANQVHSNLQDLPILFINSWDELKNFDENYYTNLYDNFMSKKWNINKLNVSYWCNEITKWNMNISRLQI